MKINKTTGNTEFGRELSRVIVMRFFVTFVICVSVIVLTMAAAGVFFRIFLWERGDPVYRFLKFIDSNAFVFIVLCSFVGFVFILAKYWKMTLGYIDTIVTASEVLVATGDEMIQLPAELKEVEVRMNQAKQKVERSAGIAREAERRKNELVMYLAHDIKTPLTSVIGYLSLLDEARDMPAEQKTKYVQITLEKAYRLEQLIDEFFEITRYNLHTIALSKESIDLYYLLVQLADEFYPLLSEKGKKVIVRVDENLTVYGDPDKLARVFNNVLKNAVAYSPDSSTIEISASTSEDTVTVVIANDGTIPPDKLRSIFDKFYRLDSARTTDTGGAGLGLAIAREIVTAHGGKIFAESDSKKTRFVTELPINWLG